ASRWAVAGILTVGALVAYLGYLNKIYSPVKKLSKMNLTIQKALVAADRIFELMDVAPESLPPNTSVHLDGKPFDEGFQSPSPSVGPTVRIASVRRFAAS